uniref:Caprin-1_dimer domain-containing protein n=1 Tax=Meloidogyne hapla TaxID=6305 RepID=A0A1I8C1X8_MELHA
MSDSADSPVKDLGKSPDKKKPKIQSPKKQSRSSGPSSSEQKNVSHGKIQSPQKQSGSSGSSSSEQKNVSHGKQSGSSGSSSSEQKTPLTEQSSNITIDIKEYDKLLKDKIELENKTRELEKLRQFVKENRMTDKKVKFLNSLEELPDDGMEKMMEYANDPKFFCDLVRKAEDEFKFMELDRKHSGEAKVYTPESLLKDAKDYVEKDPSDTIQGCEKTWLSFAAATKLVYAKVGVSFSSHNAVIGLGYLAIVSNKRIDLLTPCESADLDSFLHLETTTNDEINPKNKKRKRRRAMDLRTLENKLKGPPKCAIKNGAIYGEEEEEKKRARILNNNNGFWTQIIHPSSPKERDWVMVTGIEGIVDGVLVCSLSYGG